jgi:hypothetical protein
VTPIHDEVAADRNQRLDPFGPERRDDVGCPCAPVESPDHRARDPQRIHERDDVGGQNGLLAIAHRVRRTEPRAAVAAEVGHEDPVSAGGQDRCHVDVAVDVVGPSMQQDDRRTVGRAVLGIPNVQYAGVDLLERRERCVSDRRRSGLRR